MSSLIHWSDSLYFGSDLKATGHYEVGGTDGTFTVRFVHAVDGRSIRLRHGDEYSGSFKTVGAAKRRAVQIVKRLCHNETVS
jgi:hypothetical protein